ncbi:MAG: hypothetical protein LBM02_06420 [Lachnospiraceae bacterium]|jgi:hypothetical protein|nr:hypothetical protein [Lachnospiraceae bacterium]
MLIKAGEYKVYKKINPRYRIIKANDKHYLLDYASPTSKMVYAFSSIWFAKIKGKELTLDQVIVRGLNIITIVKLIFAGVIFYFVFFFDGILISVIFFPVGFLLFLMLNIANMSNFPSNVNFEIEKVE